MTQRPGILRISVVEVGIPPPITKNFEAWLLQQQATGKHLLTFNYTGNNRFVVHLGEVGEMSSTDGSTTDDRIMNVAIAPWRVYFFVPEGSETNIEPGERFQAVRLLGDYADVVGIGDPVEFVNISSSRPFLRGEVIGVGKIRIQDLSQFHLDAMCPPASSIEEVIDRLEQEYEATITPYDVVSLLVVQVGTTEGA